MEVRAAAAVAAQWTKTHTVVTEEAGVHVPRTRLEGGEHVADVDEEGGVGTRFTRFHLEAEAGADVHMDIANARHFD